MTWIGPVQLLAIGFAPDAKFEGRVLDELERLKEQKGAPRAAAWAPGPGVRR